MNFGLLVSQQPHARHDMPLSPPSGGQRKFATLWQRLKALFS